MQDMKDSMFSETEMAAALREIRSRDPRFDMVLFLQRLKKDVPVVIKGSLEGDAPLLKQHCAPEMVERFSGVFAVQQAQVQAFQAQQHSRLFMHGLCLPSMLSDSTTLRCAPKLTHIYLPKIIRRHMLTRTDCADDSPES